MPEMGESVTEGTVLEWHVSEGDAVAEGETVVEVSTDKVDAEVPAPASGTITKLLSRPTTRSRSARRWPRSRRVEQAPLSRRPEAKPSEAAQDCGRAGGPAAADGDGARATPVARRIAAERGVDLSKVNGTGAGGKVTKEDVLAAADGKARRRGAERRPPRARRSRCAGRPRCSPRR